MRQGTIATAAVACLLAGACSQAGQANLKSELRARLRQHAETAGNAMTRERGPLPATVIANRVTGGGPDSDRTIEALAATGSSVDGEVTLRITVRDDGGVWGEPQQLVECFTYRFNLKERGTPHKVPCTDTPALDLHDPTVPDRVDDSTRQIVVDALDRLAAQQRAEPATVRAALSEALGPHYSVWSGMQDSEVFTWVEFGGTCLTVQTTSATQVVSEPLRGKDCSGG